MKTRIGILILLIVGAAVLIASVVVAQQQPPTPRQPPQGPMAPRPAGQPNVPNVPRAPNPPNPDPLNDVIFPPDLVLNHARQLGLTVEQKTFIRAEVLKTTTSFNELQWKLQDEMELLHDNLKSSSVNEEQALAQLNKVLDIEREIKRLHIGLAVRIKNRLTPDQQEQLQRMRREPPRMPLGPDGPPRPPE